MADGREWIGGDKCYRKEEIEKARLNAQHVGKGWELEGVQKWSRRWIQGFLRDLGQDHIVSYLISPALQTMVIRAEHEKCLIASAVTAVRPTHTHTGWLTWFSFLYSQKTCGRLYNYA